MKKILAVLMIISVLFAFSACSSKEYVDIAVTVPVTDESGKTVTDKNGETVTEYVTDDAGKVATSSVDKASTKENDIQVTLTTDKSDKKEKTTKSEKTSKKEKTTKKDDKKPAEKTTEKDGETTTEKTTVSTTEKPKKREVSVKINLPYYNEMKTKMIVSFKAEGDKKFTNLEAQDVVLDGAKTVEVKLGKLKGKVSVKVMLEGLELTRNTVVISAFDATGTITPVTGIEAMKGEDD